VPKTPFSRRELVLVEESAKLIAPVDVERSAAVGRGLRTRKRGALRERSMWAVPVVMLDVGPQHALKMTAAEDH
jgi:hypothetical protein